MFARPCIVMDEMESDTKNLTVAFRVSERTRRYYEQLAEKERRNLSQVLRLVLEDHEKGHCSKNGRKKAAA